MAPDSITLGPAAKRTDLLESQLRKLTERGLVPHQKLGRLKVYKVSDLPAIRAAGIAAGYITVPVAEAVASESR